MAKAPKTAKEYLVKAKLYQIISIAFVSIGIVIFLILYIKNVEGNLVEALRNPYTILIFLVPFFPAAVFSMLSSRAEKKYYEMTKNSQKKS